MTKGISPTNILFLAMVISYHLSWVQSHHYTSDWNSMKLWEIL